jgi:uncharacterized protein YkwD
VKARRAALGLALTSLAACATSAPAGQPPGAKAPLAGPRAEAHAVTPPATVASPRAAPPPEESPPPSPPAKPLRPAHGGAREYRTDAGAAERASVARDRLREAIIKDARAIAKRLRKPAPHRDARLDLAMNDLARDLREDEIPALEVVDFLLTHYGIAEPSPHLILSHATAGADREIREQAAKQIAEILKTSSVARVGVGIARAGELMSVVVGMQETHVALAPVPRQLARGRALAITGKLVGRYKAARLVITAPDGRVSEQEPPTPGEGVRGKLACAAEGRYQVEVTAEDKNGTAVLANFPVYCGVAPPTVAPRGAGTRPSGVTADAAEQIVLALVNRDRAAAHAPPVTWDARLAEVARAHSHDMADHDFVGHVSPRTGTALDRVHKAGLEPALILENVGRAYSAQEAEAGFMSSPGHRANVLESRARKLGVGIALGKPVTGTIPLYVTQVLTD